MTTAAPATTRPVPPRPGPPRTDGRATAARGRGRWVRFEKWWWDGTLPGGGLAGALSAAGAWPREAVMLLLRLSADRAIWEGAPFPSRRRIAAQVGWTDGRVRTLLRHEREWLDVEQLARWEEVRPTHRRAAAPPDAGAGAGAGEPPKREPPKKRTATKRPAGDVAHRYRALRRQFPGIAAWQPAELDATVGAVVGAILQREATAEEVAAATHAVMRLLHLRCGSAEPPELAQLVADVELVARAARECRHPLFRRYVRGEGLPDGYDRSADVQYLVRPEPWPERLALARSWSQRVAAVRARSAVAGAADVASAAADVADVAGEPTPSQVWADICDRLRAGGAWCAPSESADVQLGDSPAEHARRREALRDSLRGVGWGEPFPLDAEWITAALPLAGHLFDVFYESGSDPPDIPAP